MLQDFDKVVARCKELLDSQNARTRKAHDAALWVSIVGLVSGAIVGPALAAKADASKSAIAAFSGLAGATNTLQNELREHGLDPADSIRRSEAIRGAINKAAADIQAAATLEDMAKVHPRLIAACTAES